MHVDLDTLLIALYVELTDRIVPVLESAPDRPGRPPEVTDAELVCIAVAQAHLRFVDERHWIRSARTHIGHLFPRLLSQSQYNVRLRGLGPLMQKAVFHLATACPSSQDVVRLIDGTKVICGTSSTTVRCSNLFGYAGYGYDRSHSMYFWGCELLLEVTADGLVTGFVLVNPKLVDERKAVLLMQQHPYTTLPPGTTAVGEFRRPQRTHREHLSGRPSSAQPVVKGEEQRQIRDRAKARTGHHLALHRALDDRHAAVER
jgi:hypothetical protein